MQPACCKQASWVAERELGSAGGFEFDLGRCERCGTPWVKAFCGATGIGGFEVISPAEADRVKRATPAEVRAIIRGWSDRM